MVLDEKIIGFSDFGIAFVAGFSIYSFLGHEVYNCKQTAVGAEAIAACEETFSSAGFGLAFSTYPQILLSIPGGKGWVVMFMITLYLLGIDSALSMLDAAKMGVMDYSLGKRAFNHS